MLETHTRAAVETPPRGDMLGGKNPLGNKGEHHLGRAEQSRADSQWIQSSKPESHLQVLLSGPHLSQLDTGRASFSEAQQHERCFQFRKQGMRDLSTQLRMGGRH